MKKYKQKLNTVAKNLYRKIRYFYWLLRARYIGAKPQSSNLNKATVLILLPEAGINLYIKTMATIASQLKLQGHQVLFIRCFKIFDRCVFMDSEGLPADATAAEKSLLCTYCYRSFHHNIVNNDFDFVDLRHYTAETDYREIKNVIAKNSNKPFDFSVDEINLTGILEYNLFLNLKKADLSNLNEKEVGLWRQYLTSLFVGYKAIRRIIDKHSISNIIMFDVYSFNSVIKELANKSNISFVNVTFPFHKDFDMNRIKVVQKDILSLNSDVVNRWCDYKNLSLSSHHIKEAVDDLVIRMSKKGTYTYSPSKSSLADILTDLGLDRSKKTIVAYPSSPDEMDAILNAQRKRGLTLAKFEDAFKDQFEWLDELVLFAEQSDNFQVIIRVHPRMAPNHREKWGCAALDEFVSRYSQNYRHVKIIWPAEPISSFDLAEIADVVTVAWSSLGAFMARLGIPVISGLKYAMPLPNEDFHLFCKTKNEFFHQIQSLASQSCSLMRLKHAYRWYHMSALGHSVDLGDIIGGDKRNYQMLSKNAVMLEKALVQNSDPLELNIQMLKDLQTENSDANEDLELKTQLLRLIHFFMTNDDEFEDSDFAFKLDGNVVEYHYKGKSHLKYSPLVTRLALLTQLLSGDEASPYKQVSDYQHAVEI